MVIVFSIQQWMAPGGNSWQILPCHCREACVCWSFATILPMKKGLDLSHVSRSSFIRCDVKWADRQLASSQLLDMNQHESIYRCTDVITRDISEFPESSGPVQPQALDLNGAGGYFSWFLPVPPLHVVARQVRFGYFMNFSHLDPEIGWNWELYCCPVWIPPGDCPIWPISLLQEHYAPALEQGKWDPEMAEVASRDGFAKLGRWFVGEVLRRMARMATILV